MKLLSSTLISGILSLHQTKPGQKESRLRTLLNEKFDFDALFSNQIELEEPGIISSSAITLDDDPIPFLPEIDLTSCKSTCAIHKRDRLPCGKPIKNKSADGNSLRTYYLLEGKGTSSVCLSRITANPTYYNHLS